MKMVSQIRVRFAPSPTGVLHIGSVRTALFNWLFARHNSGKFLLRIEDTDKLRSTEENTKSIFEILKWLEIDWDEEPVIQSHNIERHKAIAEDLVRQGKAYYCYCSPEGLAAKKEEALKAGKSYKYDGKCRGCSEKIAGTNPVIRLKAETTGKTTVNDLVQGDVTIENSQMDDLVLLRSDETPTYMLSVVVDDHDMGITHVIRGDDHLTNTFRQIQIYRACNWDIPRFGHIPLIYGPDGAKLSKRHGAASAQDYKMLGYLPEAISNYLLRLGWSHGDNEVITRDQAIEWFDFASVGRSPSRFDMAKLQNLNAHYMKERDNRSLLEYMKPFLQSKLDDEQERCILAGMNSLKERAKTILELVDAVQIYMGGPDGYDDACLKYATPQHMKLLDEVAAIVNSMEPLNEQTLCERVKELAKDSGVKLIEVAQAIRGALCGRLVSPSVFEIIAILGKEKTLNRLEKYIRHYQK